MLKKMLMSTLAVACCLGLTACNQGNDPAANTQTVKLNRLASGDLQYCDENGECQTLPYGGECVALEINIDLTTGETCQSCILEDGTSVDQGCGQSAVACVLVTLPEPDCVVCAYVNGAIIFSSCVTEEPGCTSDADCVSTDGRAVCVNGQCVAQPGCSSDLECPSGFICQLEACPMYDCAPGTDCLPTNCSGTCVPAPTECQDNSECPAGMTCQIYCMGACDSTGSACPPDVCKGVCEPVQQLCYADSDCPAGFICEFTYGTPAGNGSDPSSGAPADIAMGGYCVPQQTGCQSDIDCPRGMACQANCMPCDPSADFCDNNCQGVCVQVELYCWSDADCRPGQICEFVYGDSSRPADPGMVAPQGVCVDAPMACASDFDCSWDGFGLGLCWNGECIYQVSCEATLALCDMVPPTCEDGKVPSIIGSCYGPCVDPAMCIVPTPCVISGCSGEICAAEPMYSTCEERPVTNCFQTAVCELQADGQCGWTQTSDLTNCMANGQP